MKFELVKMATCPLTWGMKCNTHTHTHARTHARTHAHTHTHTHTHTASYPGHGEKAAWFTYQKAVLFTEVAREKFRTNSFVVTFGHKASRSGELDTASTLTTGQRGKLILLIILQNFCRQPDVCACNRYQATFSLRPGYEATTHTACIVDSIAMCTLHNGICTQLFFMLFF